MFSRGNTRHFILVGTVMITMFTVTFGQRQNLLQETTFEGSDFLSGWLNYLHCCNYSLQQTQEQIKAGSNAIKFEINKTDPPSGSLWRSEITRNIDPEDHDRWYGFSLYLKDWDDDDNAEHVFEFHPDDTTSANLSFATNGGRFTLKVNNGGQSASEAIDFGNVVSNKWIDFVIHVRWTSDSTGILQVWMNGDLKLDRNNIKTCGLVPRFYIGINKSSWGIQNVSVSKRVVYFDEVRIGNAYATFKDVAPFKPKRDYFQGL